MSEKHRFVRTRASEREKTGRETSNDESGRGGAGGGGRARKTDFRSRIEARPRVLRRQTPLYRSYAVRVRNPTETVHYGARDRFISDLAPYVTPHYYLNKMGSCPVGVYERPERGEE